MHIPGQGFGRVRMETGLIRESDLLACKANSLRGGSQKGTAENYNCKLSISVRYWVLALPLCQYCLPCMSWGCSSSLFTSDRR